MAYRSRTHRHPAHPPPPRAPHPGREKGETVWDGNRTSMLSPGSTTQREMKAVRLTSPAHAPRADRSTALTTSAPSLPTHPLRPGPRRVISGRAISGDLGPRRVTSGDLAQSRAIPELHATPLHPTPPHPPPRRAISGDLGASLARRHTCSKKEGPGWSHGAHEDVLARFSPPRPAPLGPVRRRPARRVPRPVHADPCAHRSSSALLGLLSRSRRTRGTPFPPPPTG